MEMNLKELPGDIIVLIFSKLPFFNLPTCRMVCKAWNKLVLSCKFDPKTSSISNLLFAQNSPWNNLHCVDFDLNNSQVISMVASFTFDPTSTTSRFFTIINSCNGLLCCSLRFDYTSIGVICILNPMTNEYLKLPSNPIPKDNRDVIYHYGFGFSPNTKQYKIVRHSLVSHRNATLIEIFAFDTNTTTTRQWTHLTFLPSTLEGDGTYFNGGLYWVGLHPLPMPNKLVMFHLNLEDEKFEEICFTQPPGGPFFDLLGVSHDTFYLTIGSSWFLYEVWKMEQHSSSWIKAFEVSVLETERFYSSYLLQLIKVYEDGKILYLRIFDLILYDSKTGTTQILKPLGIKQHLLVYQIDSFSFDSLDKILAGDG